MKTLTKNKKLILLGAGAVLSLAVAGSVGAISASAAEINKPGEGNSATGQTTVTANIEGGWKATYDNEVTLTGGNGTINFTFSDVVLEAGKHLSAKVESANSWQLKNGEKGIEYDIKKDGASVKNGNFLENIDGESEELSAQLTIEATMDGAKAAGAYTDTLTFTVTEA